VIAPYALLLAATSLAGTIDGPGVHRLLKAHRGHPIVVNFWATWCEPCVKEFPELIALAQDRKDWVVISVSIDDAADRPAVEAFVKEHKPPFSVYLKAPGPDEPFINGVDPHWSGAVPATWVWDASGKPLAWIEGEQTRRDVERAVKGPTTSP